MEVSDLKENYKDNHKDMWKEEGIKGKIDYRTGNTLDNWKKMKQAVMEKSILKKISKVIHDEL